MHPSTTLFLTALVSLSSALPTTNTLVSRAGGPAIVPIPDTCTITNPLPTTTGTTSFLPAPSTNSDILYSAYYSSFSTNKTAMAEQCLQQCYGYGYHVECKTAFWAENVLTPAGYYGTPGGDLATACVLFGRALVAGDFVVAPEGQGTDAFAGNIAC
ncbi:hypothetical protein T440DRAFT_468533 [Plenodomus tracheiphilus IPT5]|uniref:Apple domain-containing protein n=1 Tax=Plenodomus tracheiphilus IPT5 TaxID=1408161 RepID=A0A6A7B4V2_9PLEO|nr:hypothetical protein T440DRAFT_468533 [Plenodomus tracheiphilus IPT5]